uniref:Secreted protein n=2 Tax=Bursaphelenchus xylophilus TaxID=6326 RepID=A0A1I7S9Z9_BURXY
MLNRISASLAVLLPPHCVCLLHPIPCSRNVVAAEVCVRALNTGSVFIKATRSRRVFWMLRRHFARSLLCVVAKSAASGAGGGSWARMMDGALVAGSWRRRHYGGLGFLLSASSITSWKCADGSRRCPQGSKVKSAEISDFFGGREKHWRCCDGVDHGLFCWERIAPEVGVLWTRCTSPNTGYFGKRGLKIKTDLIDRGLYGLEENR